MTPASFTFKLTVPRDPALTTVVSDLAAHAVTYAGMDKSSGAAFVQKVAEASGRELGAPASGNARAPGCLIVFTSADGELRVTIGTQTLTQKISA